MNNQEKAVQSLARKLKPKKLFYIGDSDIAFGDKSYFECELLNASKATIPSKELLEKFGFDETMELSCYRMVDMKNPITFTMKSPLGILQNGKGISFIMKDEFDTNALPRVELLGKKIRVYPEGIARCAIVRYKDKERSAIPKKRDQAKRYSEILCGMAGATGIED